MYSAVCWICGQQHHDRTICAGSRFPWRTPIVPMEVAIRSVVPSSAIIIGDPTDFRSGDFDRGFDLDSDGILESHDILMRGYDLLPGGVLINKKIDLHGYNSKTKGLQYLDNWIRKGSGELFSFFKDLRGIVHVFKREYDRSDLGTSVLPPEQAKGFLHVGVFKDLSGAKEFVKEQ